MHKIAIIIVTLVLSGCLSHNQQTTPPPEVGSRAAPKTGITIALLGATGMVGGFVLQQALFNGYDVRALTRTPQKLDAFKERITIVKGDARDPAAIEALLRGSDVIISALGPVKADGAAAKMISSTAARHIIRIMPVHNIKRYIVVSGAAVIMPGDDRNLTGWLMQKVVSIALPDTLNDKQAEYQLLANSEVQWTLVRCPLIAAGPFEQQPRASLDTPTSFHLRAGELAYFLIEQIDSEEFIRKGPFLESR
ncbi:MAG: NAD(P)H-binding protein [Halioglobus sp.]